MTIDALRADVIAGLTAGRPSADMGFPVGLIDFWIVTAAANVMAEAARRKRTPIVYEPWMYTRFTCLVPTRPANDCDFDSYCCGSKDNKWVVNLPFTPMNVADSMGIGSIALHGGNVEFSLQRYAGPVAKHGRFLRATYLHPSAQIDGSKLYLFAPKRDLTDCKLDVIAIPEGIPDIQEDECKPRSIQIPVSGEMVYDVVARCVEKGLMYRSPNTLDRKDEGVVKNITQEK